MRIEDIVARQRAFFATGTTLPTAFRRAQLRRLREAVLRREEEILQALQADLGKAPFEGFVTETALVLDEIGYLLRHLEGLARPRPVPPSLSQLPGVGQLLPQPYGVVLVMAPWNYPFQLSLVPLAGALAAGNCVVLKPSAQAPATAKLLRQMLRELYPAGYVAVVEGGRGANAGLLGQHYDKIFFTGGLAAGRSVMAAAAERLTPLTLELGGKSPVIVDASADIPLAARRIVWGKYLNAGQTCVAPDYLLVHNSVKARLVAEMQGAIHAFYGDDPLQSEDLPRIVNEKHFARLLGLLQGEAAVLGGRSDEARLRIEPTLLPEATWSSAAMGEEIFGPVLPVLGYSRLDEALAALRRQPEPLALYLFTRTAAVKRRVMRSLPFGGGCVNDVVVHLANPNMPFGGVGSSGMGRYHGRASFEAFSYTKSILHAGTLAEVPLRYAPYGDKLRRWRWLFR